MYTPHPHSQLGTPGKGKGDGNSCRCWASTGVIKTVTQVQAATCQHAKSWSHPGQQVPFLFLPRKSGLELSQTFYRSSANIPTQKSVASNKDKPHIISVSDLTTNFLLYKFSLPTPDLPSIHPPPVGPHLPLAAFLQAGRLPQNLVAVPAAPPQPHHYSRGFMGAGREEAHSLQSTMWELQKQGTYLLSKEF